ncbi:MAG: RNA polymerase sigma factor [Myxococcota bacterium]
MNPVDAHDTEADRRAFRDGDTAAFRRLCEPLMDQLFTVCLRMLRNRAEAEDAAQDTLIRTLDRRRHYDPSRPFRPWLLRVATNVCHDRLRLVWWRRVLRWGETPHETGPDGAPSVDLDDAIDLKAHEARLHEVLGELPAAYREAVVLFHLQDMSYAEMAEITGANVPALKQRVRRGLILLRERLQPPESELYPQGVPGRIVGE